MIKLRGNERLLIVKMSSIGDVVHALPAANALRDTYPSLRISWLIEEHIAPLINNHSSIDRVVAFPRMNGALRGRGRLQALHRGLQSLREGSYDVALELQGLFRSSLIAFLSRAPIRVGRPRRREGAHLLTRRVPIPKNCHAVTENLACAWFLGAANGPARFNIPISAKAIGSVDDMLDGIGIPANVPIAVLNPSASAGWKLWPIENWIRTANELSRDAVVVLVGSKEQQGRHGEIAGQTNRCIYDLTGRTTLAELVALLNRCAVHVAGDTGSAHIAAALDRPVVGIYGPSDPLRLAPYGQEHLMLSRSDLCGPVCPHWCTSGQRCLRAIWPDFVVTRARLAIVQEKRREAADPRHYAC